MAMYLLEMGTRVKVMLEPREKLDGKARSGFRGTGPDGVSGRVSLFADALVGNALWPGVGLTAASGAAAVQLLSVALSIKKLRRES